MRRYADQHGYSVHIPGPQPAIAGRSEHWQKIALLRAALRAHELVLWLDHDVLIRDLRRDVAVELRDGDIHALAMEQTPHGPGPNTGVWLLRSDGGVNALVERVWELGPLADAQLNDQATVAHLLGFSYLPAFTRPIAGSPWLPVTGWLQPTFNALMCFAPEQATNAAFLHYGGLSEADKMSLARYHIISQRLDGWQQLLDAGSDGAQR